MNNIIPKTSKKTYIGGIVALNIHCKNGTGDWHSNQILSNIDFIKECIFGDNQECNSNFIFNNKGVIDVTKQLKKQGYNFSPQSIFAANHERAFCDLLYFLVIKKRAINSLFLNDFFPSRKDKNRVYVYFKILEKYLNKQELEMFLKWKEKQFVEH